MPGVNPSTPTNHVSGRRFHRNLKWRIETWMGGSWNPAGFTNLSGTNLNVGAKRRRPRRGGGQDARSKSLHPDQLCFGTPFEAPVAQQDRASAF